MKEDLLFPGKGSPMWGLSFVLRQNLMHLLSAVCRIFLVCLIN